MKPFHRKRPTNSKSRTGALAVEMALTVPILFFVLFASVEIARANMMVHAAESAAYEGARVGIIPGATPDQVVSAAESVLRIAGVRNSRVTTNPAVIQVDSETIEVTVEVVYGDNTILGLLIPDSVVFTGVTELTREIP